MERSSRSDLFNSKARHLYAKDESSSCPWNLSSGTFERSPGGKRHPSHISRLRDEWQLRHASQVLRTCQRPVHLVKMMVAKAGCWY